MHSLTTDTQASRDVLERSSVGSGQQDGALALIEVDALESDLEPPTINRPRRLYGDATNLNRKRIEDVRERFRKLTELAAL